MLSSANSQSVQNDTGFVQDKALSALNSNANSQNIQGALKPIASKGRVASKLSSRHNRRKRRVGESKERSAKKSRGHRNIDRIPIPSFTPITGEYVGEGAVTGEGETRVPETLNASSLACPADGGSDTTKSIANTAAVKATAFTNNDSTNLTDGSQKGDRRHSLQTETDKLACPAAPSTCVEKQKIVHTKDVPQGIEHKKDVDGGSLTAGLMKERLSDAAKEKNFSGDPTSLTAPETVMPSSVECLPPIVNNLMDERRGESSWEKMNSGKEKVKGLDKKSIDETCYDAKEAEDRPRNTTSNDKQKIVHMKDESQGIETQQIEYTKAVCSENLTVGIMKESSSHAAKERISSGDPIKPSSGAATSSTSSEAVDQPSVLQSISVGCLPPVGNNLMCERREDDAWEEKNFGIKKVKGLDKRSIDETCCDANEAEDCPHNPMSNDKVQTPREFPKEADSCLEIATLSNKLSAKKSKSFMLNESSSSPVVLQADKKQELCCNIASIGIDNTKVKKVKRSEYFGSTKSGPPEVIEILDDDHDVRDGRAVSNKKDDALSKKKKPNKSNQTKKKRKSPVSVSRSSSDSSLEDEFDYDTKRAKKAIDRKGSTRRQDNKIKPESNVDGATPKKGMVAKKKQFKTSAGKKRCSACTSCKCSSRDGASATPQKFPSLSGSDARQEQTLVNRLQRFERDIAWKEGERNKTARQLKKHQVLMLKIWEDKSSNTKAQRPRFLADAEVSEKLGGTCSKISSKEISRAQNRIFGRQKTHQPTLTQIMRGPTDDDAADKEPSSSDNVIIDCIGESNVESNIAGNAPKNAQHDASSRDAHGDFLSFWADTAPIEDSTQCLGSMSYFNHALAKSKDVKSIGKWAKATANTLQIEEDEGFDALVDLIDESMEKNSSKKIIGCSQNSIDDDDDDDSCMSEGLNLVAQPLSPRGKQVAKHIETSVKDDPPKVAAIERMCPNWKENIEITQAQADPKNLQKALHNVQQAKTNLESMKERILQAFLDRHQTLELYEKSITMSIHRLSEKEDEDDCTFD